MQKATLLTLALSVSALFASAQSYTADKVYSIKNKAQNKYASAMPQTNYMACSAANQLDLSCLFTITPVTGETGVYIIKPYADNTKVVYSIKATKEENTVGIKTDDGTGNTKWKIANATDDASYVSIISTTAQEGVSAYWNHRGMNADWNLVGIGGWDAASVKSNPGSFWTIAEVSYENVKDAAVQSFKKIVTDYYSKITTDQIGDKVGYYSQSLINEAKSKITNAGAGDVYSSVTPLTDLLNLPVNGKVYTLYALQEDDKKNYPGGSAAKWVAQKLEDGKYKFVNTTADAEGLKRSKEDPTYVVSAKNRKKVGALTLTLGSGNYLCIGANGTIDRLSGGSNSHSSQGTVFSTDFIFEEATDYKGYEVNFTESNDGKAYATLNLPFATKVPAGVTAYKKGDGTTTSSVKLEVYKNADEVLPANTPVLLQADAAGEKTFAPAAYESKVETGFSGTLAAAAVTTANAYILAKDGDAVKFCKLSATNNTINANKAYFTLTAAAANALNFDFGGVATGIENAVADKANNAPIYDLSGRRVMNAVKGGIYIQNGKKFVK